MTSPQIAYYGDDFTGSTDALEFLTRAGVRTVLFTATPTVEQVARYSGVGAIGVAGFTRALGPADMERELRPTFSALRSFGVRHVHYKVCSTFDSSPTIGSIGRAIDVGVDVFGGKFVPLVVGAPPLGRYCVFGNLFARFGIGSAGAIYRLDRHPAMSRHPVTPADESDLRVHLSRQTARQIGLLDILALAGSDSERRAALDRIVADGAEVVLFDVFASEDLGRIGALLDPLGTSERPLFSVGSSAIEMALGAHWSAGGGVTAPRIWPQPVEAKPLLAISGSCSPVTIAQIAWAIQNGFSDIGLATDPTPAEVAEAIELATMHLRAGRHVVLHTNPVEAQSRRAAAVPAAKLGTTIGTIAREVLAATGVRRLLVAGGDTSSYAARALHIEAVEMIAPLAPGAPLCRAHAPGSPADGIEVNFKGGQVGAEDYFGAVVRGRV